MHKFNVMGNSKDPKTSVTAPFSIRVVAANDQEARQAAVDDLQLHDLELVDIVKVDLL